MRKRALRAAFIALRRRAPVWIVVLMLVGLLFLTATAYVVARWFAP